MPFIKEKPVAAVYEVNRLKRHWRTRRLILGAGRVENMQTIGGIDLGLAYLKVVFGFVEGKVGRLR